MGGKETTSVGGTGVVTVMEKTNVTRAKVYH